MDSRVTHHEIPGRDLIQNHHQRTGNKDPMYENTHLCLRFHKKLAVGRRTWQLTIKSLAFSLSIPFQSLNM